MKKLSVAETLVYYGYCILTFGAVWILKIVIKKAIIEAQK